MIVAISGNLCCGKSTLLKLLKSQGYNVYEEDVESWQYLKEFYHNEHTAVLLQLEIMLSRHQQYKGASESNTITIMERSTLDSLHVFALNSLEHGMMHQRDYDLLTKYTKEFGIFPDLTIYLRCDPDVAYERKLKRDRDAEREMHDEYIKQIHQKYEEFLETNDSKIITIDVTNLTPIEVNQKVETILVSSIHRT